MLTGSIAASPEQRAIQQSVAAWADAERPERTVRESETERDGWRQHWPALAELGLFSVTASGGSMVDLAAMLEVVGYRMVPGPVVGTVVAANALPERDFPTVLAAIGEGRLAVAVAGPRTHPLTPIDGRLSGDIGPVLGAAAGVALLLPTTDGWCLLDADSAGLTVEPLAGIDHGTPLAAIRLDRVELPPQRLLTGVPTGRIDLLGVTIGAALAAGTAGWAVDAAAGYAKVREQFGRPIGSFQAIKHLCAQMLCRAEQARAVAWDAAVAADAARAGGAASAGAAGDTDPQWEFASSVAGAVALDAAVDNTKDCIQVHGGIGFTWEHDTHLHLRRAVVSRNLLGGSGYWADRVAAAAAAGTHRELRIDLGDTERHRDSVRAEVDTIAALPADQQRAALAAAGLLAPHWPAPYGRAASAAEQLLIDAECERAGLDRPDLVVGWWAIPPILQAGTPEQIEAYAGPTLRGDIVWCQLFSEPGAGSDLASLRTRADRVDGGWRLTGQKVWNSFAQVADRGICLARTDPEAPKHRGITFFVVDMATPGITVRPLREITGHTLFNEVFFDDVFVPDSAVIGEVNDGWRLTRTTLSNERVKMSGGADYSKEITRIVADLPGYTDPIAIREAGRLVAQAVSVALLAHRAVLSLVGGTDPGAGSSVQKLVGVRNRQQASEFLITHSGDEGVLDSQASQMFLITRQLSIAGGSEQILLTLAGERILGLPR